MELRGSTLRFFFIGCCWTALQLFECEIDASTPKQKVRDPLREWTLNAKPRSEPLLMAVAIAGSPAKHIRSLVCNEAQGISRLIFSILRVSIRNQVIRWTSCSHWLLLECSAAASM